ncbi:MAG: plastocyanin/azurin family copper-binding protein [Candidatus Nitrosotenuis sp.]
MNKTILAAVVTFVLLGAVLSVPMIHYADAAESKTTKKETKSPAKKPTKEAKKTNTKTTSKTSTVTVEMTKGSGDGESCAKGNKCYSPFEVKVAKGGTVTWVNKDTAAHTATSGNINSGPDGKFDSGLIAVDGKFSQKFDTAGKYDYFCMIHPWMKGKVTVS